MRVLELATGFTSASAPTGGASATGRLSTYVDDAAYVTANGAAVDGSSYINSSTGFVRFYLSSTWYNLVTEAGTETLTNKDIDGGTASNARRLTLPKDTLANLLLLARKVGTLLFATDQAKPFFDNGATLVGLGGAGGGSALRWYLSEDADSPEEVIENKYRALKYGAALTQYAYADVKVPESYTAGDPIAMKIAAYSPSTTGNFLLTSVATLIRKNTDAVTSTTNQRTSTNAALTNSGSANVYREIELDLTSTTGTVNGTAVAAGDTIRVRLERGTDTDTADVRFLPDLTEVTFQ